MRDFEQLEARLDLFDGASGAQGEAEGAESAAVAESGAAPVMKQDTAFRSEAAGGSGARERSGARAPDGSPEPGAAASQPPGPALPAVDGGAAPLPGAEAILRAAEWAEATRARSAAAVRTRVEGWLREEVALREDYPGFSLAAESADPRFRALLRTGAPVRLAYEALHLEEVKRGVAERQARATEKQVVDGIRARGARPAENGVSAHSAFITRDDVRRLSDQDMADIRRRVFSGERISFGK